MEREGGEGGGGRGEGRGETVVKVRAYRLGGILTLISWKNGKCSETTVIYRRQQNDASWQKNCFQLAKLPLERLEYVGTWLL